MAQGASVTRPQSSPLMKLPSRPANSPGGTSGAMKSATSSRDLPMLRPYSQATSATPATPPWKLMPPRQMEKICTGLDM